jgi:hypothetical protein
MVRVVLAWLSDRGSLTPGLYDGDRKHEWR